MGVTGTAQADRATSSTSLYDRIGEFLTAQRLSPDPVNYSFAYNVLSHPDGPLARAVASITDGGVRLTMRDIEALGVVVVPQGGEQAALHAQGLVAQTQLQVEGFADMVQGLREETQDFSRDLAASADAIRRTRDSLTAESHMVEEVTRITGAMVDRIRTAEAQLDTATREAAELRSKLEEARDNARRDPLTDLPNRRAFEEWYEAQVTAQATIWMAVCDIDHFKTVNDRFGHSVGDRVLKSIGSALNEACAGHFVARYGGEEFVVLLTDVDAAAARGTLETAREAVAAKRYRLRETDEPLGAVTFSAGITLASAEEGVRTVFGRADKLLYAAKNAGRNQTVVG